MKRERESEKGTERQINRSPDVGKITKMPSLVAAGEQQKKTEPKPLAKMTQMAKTLDGKANLPIAKLI